MWFLKAACSTCKLYNVGCHPTGEHTKIIMLVLALPSFVVFSIAILHLEIINSMPRRGKPGYFKNVCLGCSEKLPELPFE